MYSFDEMFDKSKDFALTMGHDYVTVDHLAVIALDIPSITDMLTNMDYDVEQIKSRMIKFMSEYQYPALPASMKTEKDSMFTCMMARVREELHKKCVMEQLKDNNHEIEPYFIMYECLSFAGTVIRGVLAECEISVEELIGDINEYVANQHEDINIFKTILGEEETAETTATSKNSKSQLSDFTENLTEQAKNKKFDKLIGREAELYDLTQILSRKKKKNPLLIGDAGVGKTEIVHGLANLIASGDVPDNLKDITILSLNVTAITGGTKFRGDLEKKVDLVIKELKEHPNVVLFIDEIHTLQSAGSTSSSDNIAAMLKPALSSDDVRIIGTTTTEEYRKFIDSDAALARRFMKLVVEEASQEDTMKILKGIKSSYEKHHDVKYSKCALTAAVTYAEKYIKNRNFPDKAIDLLDAAGARNNIKAERSDVITKEDIASEVSVISKIPVELILSEESDKMMKLRDSLKSRVFGQDEAIEILTSNVMIAQAGLREHTSTMGSFVFVGSSGTGKTEITKALAESLGVKLVRFDMSEFSGEHTVSKLIGAPPGYVGHTSGNGLLLDKIESNPNCVLLLDEIEKAHPDVLLPLLQVMDEGHLTGSSGKTVYFNNVILVMTTNLGTKNRKSVGIGLNSKSDDGIDKAIKEHMRPEFINRVDAFVRFNDLSDDVIAEIVNKNINALNIALKPKNVKVKLDKKAKEWLVNNGTEPGARPMARCITKNIKQILAPELLYGSLKDVKKTVTFTVVDDKLVIQK